MQDTNPKGPANLGAKDRGQSALVLGFLIIGFSILLNDWVVSAFKKEFFQGAIPASIYYVRASLFILGVVLIAARRSPIISGTVGRVYCAAEPFASATGFLIITYLLAESASHAAFFKYLPAEKRDAALINAGYSEKGKAEYVPHLWRNYRPNPASGIVNQHGWRNGGGAKLHKTRILCIGGSTTWGQGVGDAANTYPASLERYLRAKGYDVETVNAGVQYYSSAEDLATLQYAGLHTNPDIVIIYTGVNDVEAIMTPWWFANDYSHWRTVDPGLFDINSNVKHHVFWGIPSWTARLAATLVYVPDGSYKATVSAPLYGLGKALETPNPINERNVDAFYMNTLTMVSAVKAIGAIPVLVDFEIQVDHPFNMDQFFRGESEKRINEIKARWKKAESLINQAIHKVAEKTNTPVIPNSGFKPIPPGEYVDFCHLEDEGSKQRAAFFGDFLISQNILIK